MRNGVDRTCALAPLMDGALDIRVQRRAYELQPPLLHHRARKRVGGRVVSVQGSEITQWPIPDDDRDETTRRRFAWKRAATVADDPSCSLPMTPRYFKNVRSTYSLLVDAAKRSTEKNCNESVARNVFLLKTCTLEARCSFLCIRVIQVSISQRSSRIRVIITFP